VFTFDYRGYGGQRARPRSRALQTDIDAAMGTLLARKDIDPSRIVM